MPLNKSKGDMYEFVTHTHNPLAGECPHLCPYCSTRGMAGRYPILREKYMGEIRLAAPELKVPYGTGKTIFVVNCVDLFARLVPADYIKAILAHCCEWPENTYVFQTKNPARMKDFRGSFPPKRILGTTIETNRDWGGASLAPTPRDRFLAMREIPTPSFVTIEPIMDFDVDVMAGWVIDIKPDFVAIGAESQGYHLPEPSALKVHDLIACLVTAGIEVRVKRNLERIIGKEKP